MNETLILPILLGEFREKLRTLKVFNRDAQFPNAPNKIKVAVGMRRTGKTYFLYQYVLQLLESGVNLSQILYINFEDDRLFPLNQERLSKLVDAFYTLYPENHEKKCYLFFDEIQNVEDWALVVRRLHDSKNIELILTGSSAKLLSKEIATSLRGRSLSTEIWPYSFSEYMRANKIEIDQSLHDKKTADNLAHHFNSYLSVGGFPEVTSYDPDVRQKTLQEYLDVVIYRDIVERHRIKNPALMKYMILSMIHNVACPFAINKFYNDIKSQGHQVGKDSLYDYADYIEDTYLAFAVGIFDKSLRKVQSNPKKLYAIDPGMARALTLDYEGDLGRLFENVIYLDLRRKGCQVNYYLTEERYEIDFVAQSSNGQKKLFQVAWSMADKVVQEREERALQIAQKELKIEGEIVTLESYLRDGIAFR